MATTKELFEFINQAANDRKYAPNTALGRKAALQIYEKQLTDEERASTDMIYERLDRIAQAVDSKNKGFKSSTLLVYKKRVKNLLEDFKKYGQSSETMATWKTGRSNVAPAAKTPKNNKSQAQREEDIVINAAESAPIFRSKLHDLNVQLRPDLRLTVSLPFDLSSSEAARLKKLIDSMILEVENGENES